VAASNQDERSKRVAAGIGLVASLLLAAWLLGYFERGNSLSEDPQVAELLHAMQEPKNADSKLLYQKYTKLTPEQQQHVDTQKMLIFLPQQEQALRDFFALPESEQIKQIDRKIDAIETNRKRAGAVTGSTGKPPIGVNADPQSIMAGKQRWEANASPELRSMMDRAIRMMDERLKRRRLQPL
jgi:hypothetical protein